MSASSNYLCLCSPRGFSAAHRKTTGARGACRLAGLYPPPAAALRPSSNLPTLRACTEHCVPGLSTNIHYHKNDYARDMYFYYICRSLLPDFRNAHSTTYLPAPLICAPTQCPMLHTTATSAPLPYRHLFHFYLDVHSARRNAGLSCFPFIAQCMHTRCCRCVLGAASFLSFS